MFTEISWSSYLIVTSIFLVAYYLFIGIRYYRNDFLQLLSGRQITNDKVSFKSIDTQPAMKPGQSLHQANIKEAFEKQNLFQLAQSLSDEVQAFFREAGRNEMEKEKIIPAAKSLLAKYPAIKDSSFREFVQELIETECSTNCSIQLSDEEVNGLWN